ncbi:MULTISPECIES: DJ-1/PfpI/YhbO family deglycase/protease [Acinetobacter]|uniref:DJ-1/PfpI/YhbO family deglycase/protease n=1 Tax=Acinetobacter piscicola TaxID=2006115 RepID=A0A4Q4H1T0_9GAMM|nr:MULTISPECIES: DJ-1/PfpI/YhbO family deglycase/protease [Acinetobacter]MDM1758075.1 DJ-1/PfpI/YhbO family deglycase/protease [Acinetobacter sp. 256-1]MDM1761208.1 DJ-1/PfpI/YhbO family deglycase/protease [Acinetobacter sp. 251-1]QOW46419.1 DJ-1/PfpI/YhbO family deglycase/protease [Acinetobacter piscicola]RYL27755.1 DJ-1/PfpI/YhbO family deglycase/protease [Acinetobacter piscicola]
MNKRIAVLITHDFEDVEYHDPVEAFRAASHSVRNIEKTAGNIVYSQQRKSAVSIDYGIDEISVQDFDALMIPGGNSTYLLKQDMRFIEYLRNFANAQKPIFLSCYSPHLLIDAQIAIGRRLTSIQTIIHDLKNAGAVVFDDDVVNDNNLYISSRSTQELPRFIRECLNVLSV